MSEQLKLYPSIEPIASHSLAVSDLHTLTFEEVGNRAGRPALFLHGGPGVGISPGYRRFFDPDHYRVILVHQRGAGLSTPHAETTQNDTWSIVEDLEKIRQHFGFKDWIVMGGSWGSLLALCYAIKHPDAVAAMIIRGIFLGRQCEIDWLHGPEGAARIYPDEWERYKQPIKDATDNVSAYCDLLNSAEPAVSLAAAKSWTRWEAAIMTLLPDPGALASMVSDQSALSIARIESHFTRHRFFLESDNFILDNCGDIKHIPCHIVHGRYDVICPPVSAWQLHKALPGSHLELVPDGAHSPMDAGMISELIRASNRCRSH